MAYTPTVWVNDQAPALSAANLNKLTDEIKAQAAEHSIAHSLPTWVDGSAPALTDPAPLNEIESVVGDISAALGLSYTPTVWESGWTPARNAARLNKLEDQVALTSNATGPEPATFRFALGSNADYTASATTGQALGVHLMRTPDGATTAPWLTVDQIRTVLNVYQSRDIEPLVLVNTGGMNTSMDDLPGNLASWADRLGPGGDLAHPSRPLRLLEIGNEQFYTYSPKPGAEYADEYAAGFKTTAQAVRAANPNVGCLFMLDSSASGSTWYQRIVDLIAPIMSSDWSLVAGWVFHAYGPTTAGNVSKITDILTRVQAKGAPNTIPIYITEDGIATDNGATMYSGTTPNNYGWPTALTYDQAGTNMRSKLSFLRSHATIGPRLRVWTHYQSRDQRAPGTRDANGFAQREWFFGVTTNTGGNKGGLTQSVRDHAALYP